MLPAPSACRWISELVLSIGLVAGSLAVHAAESPNHVLELNGPGSFVELPPDAFNRLTEATVEGWVKWEVLRGSVKRFFNYGHARGDMSIGARPNGSLWFVLVESGERFHEASTGPLAVTNTWCHLAAVSGPGGMKLYYNGVLVATNAYSGSFASLREGGRNLIGETVTGTDGPASFRGRMDQVRVWNRARSEEEIRAGMFSRVAGSEAGLAGAWEFEMGADDASAAKNHGRLTRGARTIADDLPDPETFVVPGRVTGEVLQNLEASPMLIQVWSGGVAVKTEVLAQPHFELLLAPSDGPQSLRFFHTRGAATVELPELEAGKVVELGLVRIERQHGNLPIQAYVAVLGDLLGSRPEAVHRIDTPVLLALAPHLDPIHETIASLLRSSSSEDRRVGALLLGQMARTSLAAAESLAAAMRNEDRLVRVVAILSLKAAPVPEPVREIYEKRQSMMAYLFSGLLLPIALIHIVLCILSPNKKTNLYFALAVTAAVALTFLSASGSARFSEWNIALLLFVVFGLRLLYALFRPEVPRRFWISVGGAVLIGSGIYGRQEEINQLLSADFASIANFSQENAVAVAYVAGAAVFVLIVLMDSLRVVVWSVFQRKTGAGLVGTGFLILLFSLLLVPVFQGLLVSGHLSTDQFLAWVDYFPNAGIAAFAILTSLQLSWSFSHTYRGLVDAKREIEMKNVELAAAKVQAEMAREDAQMASQAKSQFLASMSHELRTPLTAIIGYSELLQEEASEPAQAAFVSDLKKIETAAKHQLGLVNEILDLSKIEAGKMTVSWENVDVCKLVGEVAETVRPLMAKQSNRLELDCPGDIGLFETDVTKLRQILLNLLSNAAKFTDHGLVRVEARRERSKPAPDSTREDRLRIAISDTGIGIDSGQMENLFQAFTQADASTSRRYGGSGLGLTISRKFCELMGGEIHVASQPGRGSVFTILLPARESQPDLTNAPFGVTAGPVRT